MFEGPRARSELHFHFLGSWNVDRALTPSELSEGCTYVGSRCSLPQNPSWLLTALTANFSPSQHASPPQSSTQVSLLSISPITAHSVPRTGPASLGAE